MYHLKLLYSEEHSVYTKNTKFNWKCLLACSLLLFIGYKQYIYFNLTSQQEGIHIIHLVLTNICVISHLTHFSMFA